MKHIVEGVAIVGLLLSSHSAVADCLGCPEPHAPESGVDDTVFGVEYNAEGASGGIQADSPAAKLVAPAMDIGVPQAPIHPSVHGSAYAGGPDQAQRDDGAARIEGSEGGGIR